MTPGPENPMIPGRLSDSDSEPDSESPNDWADSAAVVHLESYTPDLWPGQYILVRTGTYRAMYVPVRTFRNFRMTVRARS